MFVGEREIRADEWRSHKAQLILKFLLTKEPGRAVAKDLLLETLWRDQDPVKSDQCLRAAISALRRILEPDLPCRKESQYLQSKDGHCVLSMGEGGLLDANEFTRAFSLALRLDESGEQKAAVSQYRNAIDLYRGDFLEDEPYVEWAFSRREQLRTQYSSALLHLGQLLLAGNQVVEATGLALRALETDDTLEPAYRLGISCCARSGHWGRMTLLYERYCKVMRDFDLPSPPPLRSLLA